MLTEADKKWLEEQESLLRECSHCDCRAEQGCSYVPPFHGKWCKLEAENQDYRDAAEFEARVQKYLMYQYQKTVQCAEITGGFCPSMDTMLMFARLAVEEEMS